MLTDDEHIEVQEVTERIRQAMREIPFSPSSVLMTDARTPLLVKLQRIEHDLETLRERLREVVGDMTDQTRELREFQQQRAAIRAFLGTGEST